MFGSKQTGFGTTFGASTASTPGFGAGAFGTSTPSGGLFGGGGPTTSTTGGLFGGGGTGTGFGGTSGFSFGATPSSSTGTNLFGPKPQTSTTGLFGTPAASSTGFGSGFGGFGTTTTTASGGGLFGTPAGGGLFGSASTTGFGAQQSGTVVKFNPPAGQDTMVKNGVTQNINTKHQCITAMKEYESKSLEELRVEDYVANRKGKQAGTTTFGFGATPAATQASTGFAFGQSKPAGFGTSTGFGTTTSTGSGLFGGTQTGTTGLFGAKPFGVATTTQSGGFGFGTSTGTVFGQPQQTSSLFPAASTQSSLFGNKTSTFGSTATTGFGGFGSTSQAGGLFGSKPAAFGTSTTTSSTGFSFGNQPGTGSNLFAKPFSTPGFGTGFNTASTSTGFGAGSSLFGAKPAGTFGMATTTSAPAFNFGTGLSTGGTSLFNPSTTTKPFANLGTTSGTTGFGSFGGPGMNFGGNTSTLGTNTAPTVNTGAAQVQQTLLALTHSPYGDSPLFWNMKQSSTKTNEILKPTNPAAQKAVLASQHKVSPRPAAKIKPKALHGVLNGSKGQIFEGLEDEDFSFGNDTFMPRKSVKKLTLKKSLGGDSGTPSRASSLSGEPANLNSFREEEAQLRGRGTPEIVSEPGPSRLLQEGNAETDSFIHSKGIPDKMTDTPNRGTNMDDTIAMLNAKNRGQSIQPPPQQQQEEITNISIISRDESNTDIDPLDERPMTPPPPHPAGIVLTRPGYYTVPSLEALAELMDDSGDCNVEDLTIGREGYGSIFFPGITNVSNLNIDEIVFFRRKEVVVYPDDENKPPLGEGLNKKAEVTLDCVWPRDKSLGTPVKSPEKLSALKWQEKIEENTAKIGAKFIDYRPETGSWVFEVKHFSKYGLVDDSDEEDMTEQEKKRLKSTQQQQMAVQKQKIQKEQLERQRQLQARGILNGDKAQFTIGTDDSSEASSTVRKEVPMMDDDIQLSEISQDMIEEERLEPEDGGDIEILDEEPSSHRLAKSMGVDARNMQVMKASFFADDDVPSGLGGDMFTQKAPGRLESPLLRQPEGSGPSLFSSALKSKYMSPVKLPGLPQAELQRERNLFSPRLITPEPLRPLQQTFHPPVKEHMILASGMTSRDFQRKPVGTRVARVIPPVMESFQYEKQDLFADAGLFMGRSFRVGWGPGWTLAHCGDTIQPVEKDSGKNAPAFNIFSGTKTRYSGLGSSDWKVSLQKVNVAEHIKEQDRNVLHYHRELMEIQLDHSISDTQDDVPVFTPALGVEALHEYARRNQQELENIGGHPDEASIQQMGMVWDLCVALWGNMPEFKDIDIGRDSYTYHHARREAFSHWLSAVSGVKIKKEVQENKYKEQGHLQAILCSLSGRQIAEACELAQKSGDHKLALLLAQAVSSFLPRQMLGKQLEEWIELGVDNFVNETRLKIYSLLSGHLVLSSPGNSVNTCEGLDWKRALALHLWFHCQVDAPIQAAIEQYDRAYQGTGEFGSYSRPPLPPYLEGEIEAPDMWEEGGDVQDTCYHLMTLYCQRSHPMERILNPTSYTSSQLDYRLSWHLSQVLQSLSYTHLSAYQKASIHMNFMSHLESVGLWEWAIFVALHIDNPVSREDAVRGILNRHVTLSTEEEYTEKEELLKEKLNVPSHWIHHAKALRAKYETRPHEEAWHLMRAGLWNRSHEIVMKHLAADAIIHENFDYLKEFFLEFSVPDRCRTILNWNIGGKVLLKYINICESMNQFQENRGEPDLYELDRLLPEIKSLCTEVSSLQCRNSKDRLCQAEMSKKAATLLKMILSVQSDVRGEPGPSVRVLAPYISSLPMPEDYALDELRALTRTYMQEQAVL